MIEVLSHRGYWLSPEEKNSVAAFHRSFDMGFGTETDLRDFHGELVISHDPPLGGELRFDEFLDILGGRDLPLALNIKADGLAQRVKSAMDQRGLRNWFVFDMSVPDTLQQIKAGCRVFARVSDWEQGMHWHERCAGIWLDAFDEDWFSTSDVAGLLQTRSRVCVVSPELHGRDPRRAWERLRPLAAQDGLSICTDVPEEAVRYFKEQR